MSQWRWEQAGAQGPSGESGLCERRATQGEMPKPLQVADVTSCQHEDTFLRIRPSSDHQQPHTQPRFRNRRRGAAPLLKSRPLLTVNGNR